MFFEGIHPPDEESDNEPMLSWHMGRWQAERHLEEGGVIFIAMDNATLQRYVDAYLALAGGSREEAMLVVRRLSYWLHATITDEAVRIQRFGRPLPEQQRKECSSNVHSQYPESTDDGHH